MHPRSIFFCAAAALAAAASGCGPRPVAGGTPGRLSTAGRPLSDVQITLHHGGGPFEAVGFGVTGTDGTFQLFQNLARGPLKLQPGEYRCTLESAGAPVRIPMQYSRPETTTLRCSWQPGAQILELNIPEKLLP